MLIFVTYEILYILQILQIGKLEFGIFQNKARPDQIHANLAPALI